MNWHCIDTNSFMFFLLRIIFQVIFLFLPLIISNASELKKMEFEVLNTGDGLPTGEVQMVFQDSEGFMWFATRNGLCRYDGYTITVFRSDLSNTHNLSDNNINCIADDLDGSLWVGTSNGVDRFDKAKGVFNRIPIRNSTNKVVSIIRITSEGEIYIGMDDGLFVYDSSSNSFVHHATLHKGNFAITASVKAIYEDRQNNLWIGTWDAGLYRYIPERNLFYTYPSLNQRNSAHVVYQDSKERIWVGSWEGGLHLLENPYDMERFSWKTFVHDGSNPECLSDNIVYDLCEDPHTGLVWVGTRSGLSIVDEGRPGRFLNYNSFHDTNRLPSNEINSILSDNFGNMWIGSIGGGVFHTNTRKSDFKFFQVHLPEMPTAAIRSIYKSAKGKMWLSVGTYGIVCYDISNQSIKPQWELPEFNDLSHTTVFDITPISEEQILLSTYGDGLWHYREGEPIEIYNSINKDFIREDRIRTVYIDRNQHWWIGTQTGLGLRLNDGSGMTFDRLEVEGVDLSNATMIHITEDEKGVIWIATINHGLISVEGNPTKPDELIFRSYRKENNRISSNTLNLLFRDSSNRLWVGAESGRLYLYDKDLDRFVDKSPHFPMLGSMINSIEEDSSGNLWIGTNVGLARLAFGEDNSIESYRVFSAADGLKDHFFIPKSSANYEGMLYFGGYNGLSFFSPDEISTETPSSPFYITDIQIFNRPLSLLPPKVAASVSEFVPTFSDKIRIRHRYNNFSIHFASLNYANHAVTRYSYKLDGFDNQWRYSDATHNVAHYNNLSAGNYTFLLRSTNHQGIWNEEIKRLNVEVLPPLWLTWWAFLIYAVLLFTAAYLIYHSMINRVRLKNELRCIEMEQSKAEELNHAKLQFLPILPMSF